MALCACCDFACAAGYRMSALLAVTERVKTASALDDAFEWLRHRSETDLARAKLGASEAEQFLIDAAVAGSQVAADALVNAALPGAGLALKGVRSFGDASQEARRAGASVGQQALYGGLTAGKDAVIEKIFDGLGGAYGEGVLDKYIKSPSIKEAAEAFVSTTVQPVIQSAYSGEIDYDQSVFEDALRNAAIKGIISGASSAWSDAQNWALDKAYETATSPRTRAELRKSYTGSPVRPSEESYAAFIRSLYNAKGDGRRW